MNQILYFGDRMKPVKRIRFKIPDVHIKALIPQNLDTKTVEIPFTQWRFDQKNDIFYHTADLLPGCHGPIDECHQDQKVRYSSRFRQPS